MLSVELDIMTLPVFSCLSPGSMGWNDDFDIPTGQEQASDGARLFPRSIESLRIFRVLNLR